jgi:hypothetical protein
MKEKIEIVEKDGKKYIDGEEVLCEYIFEVSLIIVYLCVLIFVSLIAISYILEENQVSLKGYIGISILIFLWGSWFLREFKTMQNRGVYITNKHMITFSGERINLNNIYIRRGRGIEWGHSAFEMYKNKQLLFVLYFGKDGREIFIPTLENIAGRKNLDREYGIKTKLIHQMGEK